MRPLELELEGFSGFRDRTVVDFREADVVAFVGPTGSGKSSIIDGLTFALYGSVPRYDDERLVAPAIHQLATEAKVRLVFEVNGAEYTAVRIVRRTSSGATTREARLECGDDVLAGSAREMGPAVELLLGLTFEQFTKTVVLPQGDFAAFLHDKPSNRQQLLRRLLELDVYARMGREANQRAATGASRMDLLEEQADSLSEYNAQELERLRATAVAIAEARRQAALFAQRHAGLLAALADQGRRLGELTESLEALAAVRVPAGAESLSTKLDEARRVLDESTAALRRSIEHRVAAQEAVDEGPSESECQRLLALHGKAQQLVGALPPLLEALAEAEEIAEAAEGEHQDARRVEAEARQDLIRAERLAGAGALLAVLAVGEQCPICEQTVTELPQHDPDQELAMAKSAHAQAVENVNHSDAAARSAGQRLAAAQAEHTSTLKSLAEIQREIEDVPDSATLSEQLAEATRLGQLLRAATDEVAANEAARTELQAMMDRLAAKERQSRSAFGSARDALAALGPPPPGETSLYADWVALVAWAEGQLDEIGQQRRGAEVAAEATRRDLASLSDEVRALCLPLHIDSPIEQLGERLAELEARHAGEIERCQEKIAERESLVDQSKTLGQEVQVARQLGQLLSATGFERWLFEEALLDLGASASERLQQLSGGQYSFVATEDSFAVRDHRNADELRDVRTLSGGETFLASLALALALAEGIRDLGAATSPQLESVFLDEGFGTLDPETLDVVASAIEELGASGRMVCIVTHIRDLAERVPTRFEVHKDSRGSRVERVEI
jgi:exonuclease SbcC